MELDPVLLEELRVRLRVRLRAQVPGGARTFRAARARKQFSRELERRKRAKGGSSHDGAEVERLEEPEVGGLREAGAEDAVVDHGEVERRHERRLVAIARRRRRDQRRHGADPGGLLVLPQLQAAHLHGLLPLLRLQDPLLGHHLQLHGFFERAGRGRGRAVKPRCCWWFSVCAEL